ncbi:MAG: Hpt domain-containing protein, partial [Lachnospiraceae bacterium]|nr:Hpt domain-containing protein [Lachnospiraceae bacterium]
NAVSGARETYIAAGFDDYLTKPIDSLKLEDMIAKLLPPEKIMSVSAVQDEPRESEDLNDERLAPMRTIAEIDLQEGITNSGSVDAYLPLLKIFYESIDAKADEIEGFYKERNIKDYTIKVHALKSSARLIGASLLAEIAQALENAGKNGDEAFIDEHTEPFMKSYRHFKELLKCMFTASADDSDKPEADAEMMEGVYDEIRSSADCMDCDALEVIFSEMDNYRIPEADRDLFAKIKAAAGIYDYDAILKLIKEKG